MRKLILISIGTLAACTTPEKNFTIGTFTEFPPEIAGCSCYFSTNSNEFESEKYIYANNSDSIAFLKINDSLVKFRMINHKEIDEKNAFSEYSSTGYKLTLEIKNGPKKGEETWLKTGVLKVSDKTGQTISKNFFGECGC